MKRFIIALTLALLFWGANAQNNTISLGYCDGQMQTSSNDAFALVGTADYVSAAVRIPAESVQVYAGCEIQEIHAALASTLNLDELTLWLRSDLGGENLTQATITKSTTPKIAKGWNNLVLSTPFIIGTEPQDLYIGLTFHQKNTAVALSVLPNSAYTADALLLQLGADAEWADLSSEGVLAIEAIVGGDNLPMCNLAAHSLYLQPIYSTEAGTLAGALTVRNNALATVTSFDIECTIDDTEPVYVTHVETELPFKAQESYAFEFSPVGLTVDEPTHHKFTAKVTNIDQGEDAYTADNALSTYFDVVNRYFQRNVLVEEFTTEGCINCPRIAGFMHEMLSADDLAERVNVICHHAGYGEDWLTIYADKAYLWLYGPVQVFAPALMIDRYSSSVTSTQDPRSPIFFPNSAEDIINAVKWRLDQPAFVNISIEVDITDDNAHVRVTGERANDVFTVNPPRIVVGLIEDNIPAHLQAGSEYGYIQQHVNHVYNSTWGHVIEWNGDVYSYECDLKVDESYVKENLSVVAYVWDYEPADAGKCQISNSASISFKDMHYTPGGVASAVSDSSDTKAFYNLQGVRIQNPLPGNLYIEVSGSKAAKCLK